MTAFAAIWVAVIVLFTNFPPSIVVFAISALTIVPSANWVEVILPVLSRYAFVTASCAAVGSAISVILLFPAVGKPVVGDKATALFWISLILVLYISVEGY